jgi:hypothetical protein
MKIMNAQFNCCRENEDEFGQNHCFGNFEELLITSNQLLKPFQMKRTKWKEKQLK